MKSIKVNIGGKDYHLSGDDETLVRETATTVDDQMRLIVSQQNELADDKALPLLTALNIAEEKILSGRKAEHDLSLLVDEINKMTENLKQTLEKYV